MNEENLSVGRMMESIIGCKWSTSVMRLIKNGVCRPGAMQREVEGLTTKVLNQRLTKLTRFGIIKKTSYPEVPPRVEYQFTEFGLKFVKIIESVDQLQRELEK